MILLTDTLRLTLAKSLIQALAELYPNLTITNQEIYSQLTSPPNPNLGHLTLGCFLIAKIIKVDPKLVATSIQQKLGSSVPGIKSIDVLNAYLNFKFETKTLANSVISPILNQSTFKQQLTSGTPKTMIEYSQPNTHKELHVGHMRNLCLGNSLTKLLKYCGYDIISSTFPGDVGTHVAKCLWYIYYHEGMEVLNLKRNDLDRGEWLGKMYSAGSIKLDSEKDTPQEAINKSQLTLILKELESGSGQFYDLWKETREWSITLMNRIYKWADVTFDKWYWESDVDSNSIKNVNKYFIQGKLIESDGGSIGMDLSSDKLGFCLLLKSDGTGLYSTKDLELARLKFEEYQIEKSIYVVDSRQALHFQQVFKVLENLGFDQAKNCFHLQYNFVELPDGPMNSRKGNIVPIMELVTKMTQILKDSHLAKEGFTPLEVDSISHTVAQGAIKYGMLKMDTNKKIVFDMTEWLKTDGESGPFIQYSYARINSILSKFPIQDLDSFDGALLETESELNLMAHLMNFNSIVINAAENYKPSSLCSYLYDTAKKFNNFYHDCPIGKASNEELQKSRLALAQATSMVLEKGLSLLGIPVSKRM